MTGSSVEQKVERDAEAEGFARGLAERHLHIARGLRRDAEQKRAEATMLDRDAEFEEQKAAWLARLAQCSESLPVDPEAVSD